MTDERLVELFRIAWGGIRSLPAKRQRQAREYYYRGLHGSSPKPAEVLRGMIAEFCAEGGIAMGGLPLDGEGEVLGLWRAVRDQTEHCRDLCLVALAATDWGSEANP